MAKSSQTVVYGLHAVRHCLTYSIDQVLEIWVRDDADKHSDLLPLLSLAKQHGLAIQKVPTSTLQQKTETSHHQGIVVLRKAYSVLGESDLKHCLANTDPTPVCYLVLDTVQDPHNLGACFRTADAVGVDGIIVPNDKSAGLTATVCKVASGAVERVKFYSVTNLARCLRMMKEQNIWVYGLDGEARQTLYQTDLSVNIALVMGAEGQGLRQNTRKHCDELIRIPMQGTVESLNVSVASAVCLFEAQRQRQIEPDSKS